MLFWNEQNHRDRKDIIGCQSLEVGVWKKEVGGSLEVGDYKEVWEDFLREKTVLYFDCGEVYILVCIHKNVHNYTSR